MAKLVSMSNLPVRLSGCLNNNFASCTIQAKQT